MVKETIPIKTGKGVLKRKKKHVKKPSDSEPIKPTEETIFESVELIVENVST